MEIVGKKIAQLRHEKGLCITTFAQDVKQPVWLISLLEHAHTERAKQLIDLLPASIIEKLLQEMIEVYGVSYSWLTTRCQSPEHPSFEPTCCAPVMELPITLEPQDVVIILEELSKALQVESDPFARGSISRQSINSVTALFLLQQEFLKAGGQNALAEQNRKKLDRLLQQCLVQSNGNQGGDEDHVVYFRTAYM